MHYEIKNSDLHDLYRNRPCPDHRRRSRSIVWPGRAHAVPEIPFKSYVEQVREGVNAAATALDDDVHDTFRQADEANAKCSDYLYGLNYQQSLRGATQRRRRPGSCPPSCAADDANKRVEKYVHDFNAQWLRDVRRKP